MYKNLIIGGSGKIGKYINLPNSLVTFYKNKSPEGIQLGLNFKKFKILFEKYKFENIVLLSAITNIDRCKINKKYSKKVNLNFPKKIISFLKNKETKLIYFSSDQVYGNNINGKETSRLKPINVYGKQKKEIEIFIKKKLKNYLIIRLSRTILEKDNSGDIVSDFIKKYKKNELIIACDDYSFNFVGSSYLEQSLKALIKKNLNGIYNIAGNKPYSFFEIFFHLKKYLIKKGIKDNKIKLVKVSKNDLNFIDERPSMIFSNTRKISKIYKNPPNMKQKLIQILKKRLDAKI